MRHVCHGIGPRVFICVLKLYCVVLRAKTRVSKRVPDLPNRSLKIVSTDARPTVDSVFTFESRGNALFLFFFFFQWTFCLPRA